MCILSQTHKSYIIGSYIMSLISETCMWHNYALINVVIIIGIKFAPVLTEWEKCEFATLHGFSLRQTGASLLPAPVLGLVAQSE